MTNLTGKPAFFMRITDYIKYTQLENPRTMRNLTECGLWCRNTALCRGMAVTEIDSRLISCRLIQFDEYRFSNTNLYQREEQIYLQKFSVLNEVAFDFKKSSDCPAGVRINEYLDRLKAMKLTKCPLDIPIYDANAHITDGRTTYLLDNRVEDECETNRHYCEHKCYGPKDLVIEYEEGNHKIVDVSVTWPAICYNGEWMYFDTSSQLVYPVKSWNCAVESKPTTTMKTTQKTTTKRATTKKSTTKKTTTRKAVTTKTTRKIPTKTTPHIAAKLPVCSIGTRKIWRSSKTLDYFVDINEPNKIFTSFCHPIKPPTCCGNLTYFGIINGGARLFVKKANWADNPDSYQTYGYCAKTKGICNANTPVYEYHTAKTGYEYAVNPPGDAQQKKLFCYFWDTSAKQCYPGAADEWFQHKFVENV